MALVVVMIVATGDPSLTVIGGCFLALLILFQYVIFRFVGRERVQQAA